LQGDTKRATLSIKVDMHGVLFIGGDAPSRQDAEPLLDTADLVVGADSGIDTALGMNVTPQLLVGDMDSIAQCSTAFRRNVFESILKRRTKPIRRSACACFEKRGVAR
jgi:thiamine pyrophosphokinase